MVFLLSLRFHSFHKNKTHYKFYELCYFANLFSLAYIWIFPHSATAFRVLFALANGPLAWSVLAFSNSLVFHNREHMTSAFIHMSPMILTLGLRWYPSDRFTICYGDDCQANWLDMSLEGIGYFYLWWVIGM